jgi:hypothetical protein
LGPGRDKPNGTAAGVRREEPTPRGPELRLEQGLLASFRRIAKIGGISQHGASRGGNASFDKHDHTV